jgi:hypothetical protein
VDLTRRADAVRPEESIDWRQVRLLLAANWRTRLNSAARTPARTVFVVLMMLGMTIGALAFSAFVGVQVWKMKPGQPELAAALVHQMFLFVFFVVAVTPVLGFRGNEFLDVTKLFVHPVSHRTVFVATLLGLATSGSVIVLTLPLAGAVIGFGGGALRVTLGAAAALLLVITSVALGQFLLFAFLNRLKSRKWRDLTMVLVPLVVGVMWVSMNLLTGRGGMGRSGFWSAVEAFARYQDWLLPLPSWWASRLVTGEGWPRLLLVAALVAMTVWLVRASARLEERAYLGEVEDSVDAERISGRGLFSRVASRLSDPLGALVEKEIAILRREPAVRSILIGQSMYPVMWAGFGIITVVQGGGISSLAKFAPLAGLVAFPLLLMELGLLWNQLGLEGGGAVHSVLLPVSRRTLFAGKAVAYLLVFGTLNAVVAVALTIVAYVVTGAGTAGACAVWCLVGAVEGYCVLAVGLGVGAVISVLSPARVAVRDRRALRQQAGGREGCARGLIGMTAFGGAVSIALPVGVLFHVSYLLRIAPQFPRPPAWLPLATVPVAVAISAAVLLGGCALAGHLLAAREEEVVAMLTKSDE